MSIMEKEAIDMASVLMQAYELSDLINESEPVATYLHWKDIVENDKDIQVVARMLERKKELYDECQRFGHFHPDYHAALGEVARVEAMLDEFEAVRNYKKAEEMLDDLLLDISQTIAFSVSDTIKVPSNKLQTTGGGCGSGGCSGKCS